MKEKHHTPRRPAHGAHRAAIEAPCARILLRALPSRRLPSRAPMLSPPGGLTRLLRDDHAQRAAVRHRLDARLPAPRARPVRPPARAALRSIGSAAARWPASRPLLRAHDARLAPTGQPRGWQARRCSTRPRSSPTGASPRSPRSSSCSSWPSWPAQQPCEAVEGSSTSSRTPAPTETMPGRSAPIKITSRGGTQPAPSRQYDVLYVCVHHQ